MNKVLVGIVAVVILVAGGWYIFAKNKGASPSATPVPSMSMASPSSGSTSSRNLTATSSVKIQNFAFSPSAITVKKGTTVTWTNEDSAGHTVTETDSQSGPSSSTLSQGKSYSFTFNTVGTFHYDCTIHPYMTGTVTVTN